MERYSLYSASFGHAGGTLNLQQLDDQSGAPEGGYKTIRPGGALNPAAHVMSTASPRFSFGTCDLATLFGISGIIANGLACSTGHTARYQRRLEGGAFYAGSNHLTQTSGVGWLGISSIDVDIDSEEGAKATVEYQALSTDGVTTPVVNTDSVSFASAPVPAYVSQYYCAPCYLAAAQMLGLTRMRITPGVVYRARRADAGPYPHYAASSIAMRNPVIDLTFLRANMAVDSIGSFFTKSLGAAMRFHFQRGTTAAGGRISLAATSHLRIDVSDGSWGMDNLAVNDTDDAVSQVRVMPVGALTATLDVAIA